MNVLALNERWLTAAELGDVDQLRDLLATEGALNIDTRDHGGNTALMWSTTMGHDDCISFLLEEGANTELPDKHHDRPIHIAAANGWGKCIRLLLDGGAQVNAGGFNGRTPIGCAARRGK